jgi:hypothetical protein
MRTCLALGIASLYLAFAGGMGLLLRRMRASRTGSDRLVACAYACLLLLPGTVLVLSLSNWPLAGRLVLVSGGAVAIGLAAVQPKWAPRLLWQRRFGQRYLALAMVLTLLGEVAWALTAPGPGSSLIGAAAGAAGAASLRAAAHD